MTAPVEVRNRVLNARLNPNMVTLNNAKINISDWHDTQKSWSLNFVCKDTTLDQVNPYAVLDTDCTGLAGATVVAAARYAWLNKNLYDARTLVLVAYDSSSKPLGIANYGKTPNASSGLITLEWTVPADTSRLEYRLYTTIDDSTGAWWAQPLLCTKAEWQALQGVGVTYFNQDTLPE